MAQVAEFRPNTTNVCLIKQGAEAKIYSCLYEGRPAIVKERFSKAYRNPILDRTLTVRRTRAEAKCIQRCQNIGIRCPEVYFVDSKTNMIYMEHIIDSITVKDYLSQQLSDKGSLTSSAETGSPSESVIGRDVGMSANDGEVDIAKSSTVCLDKVSSLLPLGREIGRVLGTMHRNHTIHGDLTTSNLLLEGKPENRRIALIDFGLGSYDESAEDKGVDLYVLERALLSTHPATETLFSAILDGYKDAYGVDEDDNNRAGDKKKSKKPSVEQVLKKLNEVRLRGRKRTMVG